MEEFLKFKFKITSDYFLAIHGKRFLSTPACNASLSYKYLLKLVVAVQRKMRDIADDVEAPTCVVACAHSEKHEARQTAT